MKDSSHLGIVMMVITMMIFAGQDAVSRILAERYNVMMIVMLRYWFMALFVLALAIIWQGGVARVAKSNRIWVQIGRGVLLVLEIVVAVTGFVLLGLVESHVIFGFYPLIVTALSVPVLGEQVGWRRWVAVVIGFIGVLVILRPGFAVFSPFALIPLLAAFMFAFYSLMTRLVSKTDRTETSLFWMAIAGCVTITFGVPFFW